MLTHSPSHEHEIDAETARITLSASSSEESSSLDGVWWPRSRDLAVEVPQLVATLQTKGIRISRVAYSREGWDGVVRKLATGNRTVRLGWFRTIDPNSVSLTSSDGRIRLDLLVIPPESQPGSFTRAVALVLEPNYRASATATLAAVQANPPNTRADDAAEAAWESEGGPTEFEPRILESNLESL